MTKLEFYTALTNLSKCSPQLVIASQAQIEGHEFYIKGFELKLLRVKRTEKNGLKCVVLTKAGLSAVEKASKYIGK